MQLKILARETINSMNRAGIARAGTMPICSANMVLSASIFPPR